MQESGTPEIEVINPLTGKRECLQKTLDGLFSLSALSMTAEELDRLNLSAETLDGLKATAVELGVGKILFNRRRNVCPAQTKLSI